MQIIQILIFICNIFLGTGKVEIPTVLKPIGPIIQNVIPTIRNTVQDSNVVDNFISNTKTIYEITVNNTIEIIEIIDISINNFSNIITDFIYYE